MSDHSIAIYRSKAEECHTQLVRPYEYEQHDFGWVKSDREEDETIYNSPLGFHAAGNAIHCLVHPPGGLCIEGIESAWQRLIFRA